MTRSGLGTAEVCVFSSGRAALPGLLAALSCRGDIGRPRPGTGCLSHCPPEAGGSPGCRAAQATGSRSGALLEAVVREQAELESARLFSPFSAASVRADCALRSDGESQGWPSPSHVPVRRTPARPTERTQRVTPSSWAGPPPPGLLRYCSETRCPLSCLVEFDTVHCLKACFYFSFH